jgi:hypothetical protein
MPGDHLKNKNEVANRGEFPFLKLPAGSGDLPSGMILRLNYSGNVKTMNNHSIGNLGTARHGTQEGDDHKR